MRTDQLRVQVPPIETISYPGETGSSPQILGAEAIAGYISAQAADVGRSAIKTADIFDEEYRQIERMNRALGKWF